MSDSKNNIHDSQVSVMAIISLAFKYIKFLVAAVFVFMILGAVYKTIPVIKEANLTEEEAADISKETYEDLMLQWEVRNTLRLQDYIANEKQRDLQFLYNEEAPIMKLDSTNVVKTVVPFVISSDESYVITSSSGDRNMPVASIAAQKYIDDWKSVDIVSLINNGVPEDSWLREVIYLKMSETNLSTDTVDGEVVLSSSVVGVSNTAYTSSCPLVLTVYSATPEEGNRISGIVADYLLSMKDIVESESFSHDITMNTSKQTVINNPSIANYQIQCVKKANSFTNRVQNAKEAIRSQKADRPESPIKGIVKFAIICAIIGLLFGYLCLIVKFVCTAPVSSSFEMADKSLFTYLGSYYRKRSWNEKVVDRLLNERVFNSKEDALEFIKVNAATVLKPGAKVLVASSFYKDSDKGKEEVSAVISALHDAGFEATFEGNTLISTTFVNKLKENDTVILLEKNWKTRWQNIDTELDVINRLGKNVSGFVLV